MGKTSGTMFKMKGMFHNAESLFTFKKHYRKVFIIIIDIAKGIVIKSQY